ncbi:hypothetical protein FHW89_003906 [Mucilaginibacter sp. SG564]|nr:hypothetical protein [Mucilaginibacter sp. SG564]
MADDNKISRPFKRLRLNVVLYKRPRSIINFDLFDLDEHRRSSRYQFKRKIFGLVRRV